MQPRVENDEKLQSEENKRQGGIRKGVSFSRGTDKVGTESILMHVHMHTPLTHVVTIIVRVSGKQCLRWRGAHSRFLR